MLHGIVSVVTVVVRNRRGVDFQICLCKGSKGRGELIYLIDYRIAGLAV